MKGRRRSSMGQLNLVILPVLVIILALLVNAALSDDNLDPSSDTSGPVSGDSGENRSDPASRGGENDGEDDGITGRGGGGGNDDEDDEITGRGGGGGNKGAVDKVLLDKFVGDFCKGKGTDGKDACNYGQIVSFFDEQSSELIKTYGYPRLFPYCITRKQILDPTRTLQSSHLYRFSRVFEGIEVRKRYSYMFENGSDSTVFNKTFVTSMEMSRINTLERDMVNMRQWVHITIKTNGNTQGIFMQSIVGPFGLPFGEFNVDFPCKDLAKSSNIAQVGQLAYCSYRPKSNIVHPSVYVGYNINGQDEWHVHFKYNDITCMETSYVQFAMIVVKKFDQNPVEGVHYTPIFSPVFYSQKLDSPDGSPYPYYPEWSDKMYCNITNSTDLEALLPSRFIKKSQADQQWEKIQWIATDLTYKIQPSEEYDRCITSENSTLPNATRDDIHFECPPGPFKCDESNAGLGQDVLDTKRELDLKVENNVSECYPCAAPDCVALFGEVKCGTRLEQVFLLKNESATLKDISQQRRERSHGAAATVAFLFVIPLGNFVARFYKDVGGRWVLGNGPWIFVHAACSVIAIVMSWISIGHMVPNLGDVKSGKNECRNDHNATASAEAAEDYKKCIEPYELGHPHQVIGFFTIILLHIVPFTGFVRPSSSKLRLIFTAIHSHMGYLIYISGVIAVTIAVYDNHCGGGLFILFCLVSVPVVFSIVAIVIDVRMDRKLGIIPMRKQWPVYEQVELQKRGPLELIKWVILGLFTFFLFGFTSMSVANTYVIEASLDSNFSNINALKHENGFLGRIQGLFSNNCSKE